MREHPAEFGVFGIFARRREAVLAVFAGLNQVVQNTDALFVDGFHKGANKGSTGHEMLGPTTLLRRTCQPGCFGLT